MECYQCLQAGVSRKAAGLCHHCSAALCAEHICSVEDPLAFTGILSGRTDLPKRGRILLCDTCRAALEQPFADGASFASHSRI